MNQCSWWLLSNCVIFFPRTYCNFLNNLISHLPFMVLLLFILFFSVLLLYFFMTTFHRSDLGELLTHFCSCHPWISLSLSTAAETVLCGLDSKSSTTSIFVILSRRLICNDVIIRSLNSSHFGPLDLHVEPSVDVSMNICLHWNHILFSNSLGHMLASQAIHHGCLVVLMCFTFASNQTSFLGIQSSESQKYSGKTAYLLAHSTMLGQFFRHRQGSTQLLPLLSQ